MTDLFAARNARAWDDLLDEAGYPGVLQKWFWGEQERRRGRGVERLVGRQRDGSWWMAQGWGPAALSVRWAPEGPVSLGRISPKPLELEPRKFPPLLLASPLPPAWSGAVFGRQIPWPRFHPSNVVVELAPSEEDLMAQQHQKWRNRLRVALRGGSKISQLTSEEALCVFRSEGLRSEERKGFRSPWTPERLRLILSLAPGFYASAVGNDGKTIAAQLVIYSGQAAMLVSSLVTEAGRNFSAGYLLLWDALKHLKSKGVRFFNLGGVDKGKAQGVAAFKSKCGGQYFEMPGTFLMAAVPMLRGILPLLRRSLLRDALR